MLITSCTKIIKMYLTSCTQIINMSITSCIQIINMLITSCMQVYKDILRLSRCLQHLIVIRPIEVASVIELSEASGWVAAGLFMTER